MQSLSFLPESHRMKSHRISCWLALVKVPKLCRVWAQGVIT